MPTWLLVGSRGPRPIEGGNFALCRSLKRPAKQESLGLIQYSTVYSFFFHNTEKYSWSSNELPKKNLFHPQSESVLSYQCTEF